MRARAAFGKRPSALCAALIVAMTAFLALCARAADFELQQRAIHFSQSDLTIRAGDSVFFRNVDDVIHNLMVSAPDSDPEDKGLQSPGKTVMIKFMQAGTFEVRCAIHPRMKMTVTVTK